MLPAYVGSAEFLAEQRLALGHASPQVRAAQASEVAHLTRLFRSSKTDRHDATELLRAMRSDTSGVFTEEQRLHLSEVASECIATTHLHAVIPEMHGSKKEQTHLYSHGYYTEVEWATFCDGSIPMHEKYSTMQKSWLSWGLRFPSGPSYRIGLATLLKASGIHASGHQAHDMLNEFKHGFKTLRGVYGGDATLKIFPARVEDFVLMYPTIWTSPNTPVACRIPVNGIMEIANPRVIACRSNSHVLCQGGHDAQRQKLASALQLAMNDSGVGDRDGRLKELLASLATPLKNAETRTRRGASTGSLSSSSPLVAPASPQPLVAPASPELMPMVAAEGSRTEHPTPYLGTPPGTPPHVDGASQHAGVVLGKPADTGKADAERAALRLSIGAHAELAGLHLKKKKAEARLEDTADVEKGTVAPSLSKPRFRIRGKRGATGLLAPKDPASTLSDKPKRKKGKGKPKTKKSKGKGAATTMKILTPSSDTTTWPKLSFSDLPLHWGGGRIYINTAKTGFRAYRRTGDRVEKAVAFGPKASVAQQNAAWKQALQTIVDDPRPRVR